jgi:flagellar motor switch/type III secretory pathway protein FliN
MSPSLHDKPMTRQNLLGLMRKMRSLAEPETTAPASEIVDWHVPHRFSQESADQLRLFSVKLAGHLESCLQLVSGQPFEVKPQGLCEQYAGQMSARVVQEQPKVYYLPVTQPGKGHVGFVAIPFETASMLVGCMLRDPEAQIGADGQMSSLAESILLDAAISLAEALAEGLKEFGQAVIEKTEQLIFRDWPVRFHELEDCCEFRFEATFGSTKLMLTLVLLDEVIADIAQIKGPFGRAEEKKEHSERIVKQMRETPMQVTALLSSSLITLNDLLTLETGDIIMLDRKICEPVDVLVNGQPCFCAWPALHAGCRAVVVADEKARNN